LHATGAIVYTSMCENVAGGADTLAVSQQFHLDRRRVSMGPGTHYLDFEPGNEFWNRVPDTRYRLQITSL